MKRIILAAIFLASAGPALAGPQASFSTGVELSEGDYGISETTKTWRLHNQLTVRSGRFHAMAALPYLRLEGPGNVIGGGGLLGLPILIDPGRPSDRRTRSGLGDLRIAAGYTLSPADAFDLTFQGQMKLPTASARRGLGTGEMDVALAAEASRTVGGITPFLGLSYTMPGDPEGYRLRDSLAVRSGVGVQIGRLARAHVGYDYAQSPLESLANEQQISAGLDLSLSRRAGIGLYGSAGLSETAPDVGAGLSLRLGL